MVVHIVDILRAQLVTIVVDFGLNIERTVHIIVLTVTNKNTIHLCQSIICQLKHLVHVVILLLCEVFLTIDKTAAKLHLSTSPTFERQKRLERDGYIERYMAVVNPHKVGNGIMVLCNIRLKQHSQELIQEFMNVVQNLEEITECYNTSGDYDFLIKVYARDMKSYQQFMLNTLGTINCIGSLHSIFVIDETKNTHGVPISMH